MINQTYFTDEELVEMIQNPVGEHGKSTYEVGRLVKERLAQKTTSLQYANERLNVAAEHMGHQLITDLIEHG